MTLNKNGLYPVNFYKLEKRRADIFLPYEQLVSPTLPEREITASNRLIFHRAGAKYITPHVMHSTKWNHYSTGLPKRSSYVAERTRKRQNRFTNPFYRFKFNLFLLGVLLNGGSPKETNGPRSGFSLGERTRDQLLAR